MSDRKLQASYGESAKSPPVQLCAVSFRRAECNQTPIYAQESKNEMYSCPNAMLLVLGFPPSSLAGIVEIRSLFLLHVCGTVTRRRLPAATNEAN